MFGLSESSIDPGKEFLVKWDGRGSSTARLLDHFAVLDEKVRVAADFADGSPAAYEHPNGKEKAIFISDINRPVQ